MPTPIFLFQNDKHIHGPDLGQVVLRTLQPQVLGVPLHRGLTLGHDTWSIIDAQFVCARASRSCTDVFGGTVEGYGLEAVGEVGAYGGADD
jgi:hypothetical protein